MAVTFKAEQHSYLSNDGADIQWISATTLLGSLKQPFDAKTQAEKSARNSRSKWFKMDPVAIQQAWRNEADRAVTLGNWYHNQREEDLCSLQSMERWGKVVPIYKPTYDPNGDKIAPNQKLTDGIYPEHMVYLKSAGLCGQSDLVEVVNGEVYITDYKTNKEIKTEGYKGWDGTKKMRFPVSHLDDCNLFHYNLQLSIYMYIILKHNPKLKSGKIVLHHILFEENGQDQFGYPIVKRHPNGDPIVKDIIPYELTYLRQEVISIIHWLADNKVKVLEEKKKKAA